MYAEGCGTSKDESKAIEWYETAAAQGHAPAFHNLGWTYAEGHGVPQDDIKAYAHFSVAVALGHRRAAQNVAKMEAVLPSFVIAKGKSLADEMRDSLHAP